MDGGRIPVVVLGGNGYVAGELLRLLAGHPCLRLAALVSHAHAGARVDALFPHLAGTALADIVSVDVERLPSFPAGGRVGVLAATPHGATAALLESVLGRLEAEGATPRAVDLSADFRFRDRERFTALYGPHGAPGRLAEFVCAVPEHVEGAPSLHAAQPGCFTTAVVLAAFPLLVRGLIEPSLFVSALTGSSGAGRGLSATTHHPERRSNLFAYAPLAHRHEAEMRALLASACGVEPEIELVPHAGPFVRGIHATLRLELTAELAAADLVAAYSDFYGDGFVRATQAPPHLTEVIGTNRCRLGVATRGRIAVVTSVIDNLVKGAAGGAMQWLNRLLGLPDDTGLRLPGLGMF